MTDLIGDGLRMIEALVRAPIAWQSPAELASAMGREVDETTDLMAELDADGWLAAWERAADVVVTLSVAGAARLGVRLVEVGREEVPRWARLGEPEPRSPRASGVFRSERAAGLDRVVDPSRSAEEALESAEEALERPVISPDPRVKAFADRFPNPTRLVGSGLTPWPGPGDGRKSSCPSCGSRRLEPTMYCLYCDRWGLDHLLTGESPRSTRAPRGPRDEAALREQERRSRKARRRARRHAAAASPAARRRPERLSS